MKIQKHGGRVDPRAAKLMSEIRRNAEATRATGESNGFTLDGHYDAGKSNYVKPLRLAGQFDYRKKIKIDPKTREIESYEYKDQHRSFKLDKASHMMRDGIEKDGTDTIYARTVESSNGFESVGYTEVARVSADGEVKYQVRQHLGAKIENYFRDRPYTAMLAGQLVGGTIGGLAGVLLGGGPAPLNAILGASVGALAGGTMTHAGFAHQTWVRPESASVPAHIIHQASMLGSLGAMVVGLGSLAPLLSR